MSGACSLPVWWQGALERQMSAESSIPLLSAASPLEQKDGASPELQSCVFCADTRRMLWLVIDGNLT